MTTPPRSTPAPTLCHRPSGRRAACSGDRASARVAWARLLALGPWLLASTASLGLAVTTPAAAAPSRGDRRTPTRAPRPSMQPDAPLSLPSPSTRTRQARSLGELPPPRRLRSGACQAQWSSVLVFFNMPADAVAQVSGYKSTSVANAKEMIDEGTAPMSPSLAEFTCEYWSSLSYGKFAFSVNTPRQDNGDPKVLSLDIPPELAKDWRTIIALAVDDSAEALWTAAGKPMRDGKRWIPSIVLIQNYVSGANADYTEMTRTVGGKQYIVGDRARIRFSTTPFTPAGASTPTGRQFWGVLMHEYAHNFLDYGDLYGPQGAIQYWDLLGDTSRPGAATEIFSSHKKAAKWIDFKQVISGPTKPVSLSLSPYSTTGEAIKVVPDPVRTPHEYFLLEYRASMGKEVWRPDGNLAESGLLITHVNERLDVGSTWLSSEAPNFDPEFADGSDLGLAWRDDKLVTVGRLFGPNGRDAFTPTTMPSSSLYGGRDSGLAITNIKPTATGVTFSLQIGGTDSQVGWSHGAGERALAGRLMSTSATHGKDMMLRRGDAIAILEHRQSTWQVRTTASGDVDGFTLGASDQEVIADFDGDGLEEIFVFRPGGAAMLEMNGIKLDARAKWRGMLGGSWTLGANDRAHTGDFDGDGKAEVLLTSPKAIAVLDYFACPSGSTCSRDTSLTAAMEHSIEGWNASVADRHFVGRFSSDVSDQIVIIRDGQAFVLGWSSRKKTLTMRAAQSDFSGLAIDGKHQYVVGDFDGDGVDELFVHRGSSAAVLEWGTPEKFADTLINDHLVVAWKGTIPNASLSTNDRIYGAHVGTTRDGVLLRSADGLRVLRWDGGKMVVGEKVLVAGGTLDRRLPWNDGDDWVIGDFHGTGPDPVEVGKDYIVDGIDDVFVHGTWGTATIGINPVSELFKSDGDQVGLTWYQPGPLLRGP